MVIGYFDKSSLKDQEICKEISGVKAFLWKKQAKQVSDNFCCPQKTLFDSI